MPRPRRPITPEDCYRLRSISDPQISPDGRWIACVISQPDRQQDRFLSDIWLISTRGRKGVQLTNRYHRDSSPRWSLDGSRIAFVAPEKDDDKAKSQIWVIPLHGGEARRVTRLKQGASAPVWSPDGKQIAFLARNPKPEDDERDPRKPKIEVKDGRVFATDVKVIDRIRYRSSDFLPKDDRRHVYLMPAAGGQPRKLTDGDYDDHSPAWSPDGKQIAFVSNRARDPDWDLVTDIWAVPSSGGKARRVSTLAGGAHSPTWSPDGKVLAYIGSRQPKVSWLEAELYIQPARGGKAVTLTASLDRLAQSPRWAPDSSAIYFTCADEGFISLWRASLNGKVARVLPKERCLLEYSVAVDHGSVAYTVSAPDRPGDLFLLDGAGRLERRLTHGNQAMLARLATATTERFWCRSFDGTRIQGWLVKPPGFRSGKRYPVVLITHGGPYWAFFDAWRFDAQVLAAHGHVVIYANCRGSVGYGREFQTTVVGNWGAEDSRDYVAAVDHVLRQGCGERGRVGVYGGSYGGYMTVWLLGATNRFAAGVAVCAATDEPMFYYTADMPQWSEQELGGAPWERPEKYRRVSASSHAHKIRAPLLFLHAEDDTRVPINNSEIVYTTVKRMGVESVFVRYPSGGHGFSYSAPRYICDTMNRIVDWFDRHLKRAPSKA
jgi:dipeptidyl aminopeptidase/acylaminoacyl peptidase